MRVILSLACVCFLYSAPRSWAGALDEELNKQMPTIVEALKKAKVKNVGVLRFRFEEAGKEPRFDSPVCGSLPERLENLLVIHGGPKESSAIGVIRGAGKVAGRAKVGPWFSESSERAKLFDLRYPLAWGKRQVEPDLFLTGKLELGKNRERTTLTVESFDRKRPEKLTTIATIRFATDRGVLRDLGYDLSLREADRKILARKPTASAATEDKYLLSALNARGDVGDSVRPDSIAGIAFDVLVDGEPVPCENKDGRWVLVSPAPKAKIAFRLVSSADKKLSVAVRLNGLNTIDESKDEPERSKNWVTKPKGRYLIEGFYLMGKEKTERSPFAVLVGADAQTAREEFGDAAGRIDVDVYEEGNAAPAALVISRGLPPSKEKEARASYLALRSALLKSSKLKTQTLVKNDGGLVTTREIIVADKEALVPVERPGEEEFANPRLLQRLTIHVVPGG